MESLEDLIEEYEATAMFHNMMIENIAFEFKMWSGTNPLETIRDSRKRLAYLASALPADRIAQFKIVEWNEQNRLNIPEELRTQEKKLNNQVEKIKNFRDNYWYLEKHYPEFNVNLFLYTATSNMAKIYKDYIKKGGLSLAEELTELEQSVVDMQSKKIKSLKILDNHKAFEELKAKYPEQDFNRKASKAEKDLKDVHQITKVNGFKTTVGK